MDPANARLWSKFKLILRPDDIIRAAGHFSGKVSDGKDDDPSTLAIDNQ